MYWGPKTDSGGGPCPTGPQPASAQVNVTPVINSIEPDTVLAGSSNVQLEIDGHGFGSTAPTVNLPSGVSSTGQQSSNDTKILIKVNAATTAPVGLTGITVTNTTSKFTSNSSAFTVDGPFYMTVVSDQLLTCSGCTTTVPRNVKYQVMNFSNSAVAVIPIGETVTLSAWNCQQNQPGNETTPCSAGEQTDSTGQFTDGWSLGADGYTPAGCGNNVDDHWLWCPANRSIGHLNGFTHTNAVSINNVVNPPNKFAPGTVINP